MDTLVSAYSDKSESQGDYLRDLLNSYSKMSFFPAQVCTALGLQSLLDFIDAAVIISIVTGIILGKKKYYLMIN